MGFSTCSTPLVKSFSPQQGNSEKVISIVGSGFSNVTEDIEVTFGGFICNIIDMSVERIGCKLGGNPLVPIGQYLPLSIQIKGLGSALLLPRHTLDRSFVLLPHIVSMDISSGSIMGGTRVTLSGNALSNQDLQV